MKSYKRKKSVFSVVSFVLVLFILLNLILPGFTRPGAKAEETGEVTTTSRQTDSGESKDKEEPLEEQNNEIQEETSKQEETNNQVESQEMETQGDHALANELENNEPESNGSEDANKAEEKVEPAESEEPSENKDKVEPAKSEEPSESNAKVESEETREAKKKLEQDDKAKRDELLRYVEGQAIEEMEEEVITEIDYDVYPETPFTTKKTTRRLVSPLTTNDYDHPTSPGQVEVFKDASPVEGLVNTWDITLRIEGMDTETTSDIVLVIDKSGSMAGSKMTNAKDAAKKFVETLIPQGGGGNTRIAVVSFSDSVSIEQSLTTNRNNLINSINGLSAVGGTHTQAGIRQAKAILDNSSNADNKHIVLLSDGVPTYSYGFTNTSVRNSGATFESGTVYYQRYQGIYALVGEYADLYFRTGKDYNRSAFSDTRVGNGMGRTNNQGAVVFFGENWISQGWYDYPLFHDHGNSTINESKFAKNAGYAMWTVALSAGTDGNAILNEIASPGKAYTASESDLQEIFGEIAGSIKAAARDIVVTDPMGTGFIIPANQENNISASQGTFSYQNNTINWNAESLHTPIAPGSNIKYAELRYRVEITDDILGVSPDSNGLYPTNDNARVTYQGITGSQTKYFPEPKVNPIFLTLTKTLMDKSGNVITDNNRTFSIKVLSETDGDTIYPRYDRTFNLQAGQSITSTDLRLADTYTVSEIGASDYDVTVKVGGQVTNEFVVQPPTGNPLTDTGQEDINLELINKEKALGQLIVSKLLKDKNGNLISNDSREFNINVTGPNNYSSSFTIKGGESKTLSNLVYGEYVVVEENPGPGFSVTMNPSDGKVNLTYDAKSKNVSITNIYEPPLMDVTASKVWQGGIEVHPTIWFKLYRQTSLSDTAELVPGAEAKELVNGTLEVSWDNLPKTDLNGIDYIYSVKEFINIAEEGQPNLFLGSPAGYSKTENGLTVTNKWRDIDPANVTSVSVTKFWEGVPEGEVPEAVIELYDADEPNTVIMTATLTPENNTVTWEGLTYAKGNPLVAIDYRIREVNIYGYQSSSPVKNPISISDMVRTEPNNSTNWPISKPSFVITKPTGGQPFIIWTLNHMPESERATFITDLYHEAAQKGFNLGPFGSISINTPVIWIEGAQVEHDIYPNDSSRGLIKVDVEFDQKGNIVSSYIDFQSESSWTQFLVGTYSAQEFTLTNTNIITDITIEKEVTGNMADMNKEFNFEVQIRTAQGALIKDLEDFTLEHGETNVIKAPKNSYLWIKETDASGYDITVTSGNEIVDKANDGWYKILVEDDLLIKFENNKDTEIYTGVYLNQVPYILLLAITIIGLSVIVIRNIRPKTNADRRYYDE